MEEVLEQIRALKASVDEQFRESSTNLQALRDELHEKAEADAVIWGSQFIKTTAGDMLQKVQQPGHSGKSNIFYRIRRSALITTFALKLDTDIDDASRLCDRVADDRNQTVHCVDLEKLSDRITQCEELFKKYEKLVDRLPDQYAVIQSRKLFEDEISLRQQEGRQSLHTVGNLSKRGGTPLDPIQRPKRVLR